MSDAFVVPRNTGCIDRRVIATEVVRRTFAGSCPSLCCGARRRALRHSPAPYAPVEPVRPIHRHRGRKPAFRRSAAARPPPSGRRASRRERGRARSFRAEPQIVAIAGDGPGRTDQLSRDNGGQSPRRRRTGRCGQHAPAKPSKFGWVVAPGAAAAPRGRAGRSPRRSPCPFGAHAEHLLGRSRARCRTQMQHAACPAAPRGCSRARPRRIPPVAHFSGFRHEGRRQHDEVDVLVGIDSARRIQSRSW